MTDSDNIAWIDVESSDLNPWRGGRLLEVACVITDRDLNILDEAGYSAIVKYTLGDTRLMMQKANPFVREMHEKTGLWAAAAQRGAKSILTIDKELARYLASFNANRSRMPLAGNSVRLDLNYVEAYLPLSYQQLDYRVIDVSSIREIATRWYGEHAPPYEKDPSGWHTADADIRESIKELAYYRGLIFRGRSELIPECQACYEVEGHKPGCPAASRPSSITCPTCKRTSHNPNDVEQGYCGFCHRLTSQPLAQRVSETEGSKS